MDAINTAKQITISIIIMVITSCTFNIPGIYVAKDNKNRYDTLFIYENNTFTQKITSKEGKILYLHGGTWKDGHLGNIDFSSIFLDGDSLYYDIEHVKEDQRSYIYFEMARHNGYNTIYWSEYIDLPETYHYYYKIKDYE